MKQLTNILFLSFLLFSCQDDNLTVEGKQSPMGEVGSKVTSTSQTIMGVSNFSASVVSLSDGISTFSASSTVTNEAIKNVLSNIPDVTVNGDKVTAEGLKFKITTEGIESVEGMGDGVIVNYGAKVGDSYPIKLMGNSRKVVYRSTDDDYNFGFFDIKVVEVEVDSKMPGIDKINYWANHKFGIVGVQFKFDDGTVAKFPVYFNSENP
jgi:hypothetical protein